MPPCATCNYELIDYWHCAVFVHPHGIVALRNEAQNIETCECCVCKEERSRDVVTVNVPPAFCREQFELVLRGLGLRALMCTWNGARPTVTITAGDPPDEAAILIMKEVVDEIRSDV